MNRKLTGICAAAFFAAAAIPAFAASAEEDAGIRITASITNAGAVELAPQDVTVIDRDGDGKYTIDEALYAVHEFGYNGGAAAGYASAQSDWGLSLTKLWGIENGGSYGYYLNDQMAMSLADEIKEDDYLSAFVYGDTTGFSDRYTFFDTKYAELKDGEDITLTLTIVNFDENWSPVNAPLADAVITINGEKTDYKTDADGKVTISPRLSETAEDGSFTVSASVDGKYIAAPVSLIYVTKAAAVTDPADTTTTTAETTTTTTEATTTTTEATTTTTADTTTTTTTTAATTTVAPATTTKSGAATSVTKTDAAKTGDAAVTAVVLAAAIAGATAYATRRRND